MRRSHHTRIKIYPNTKNKQKVAQTKKNFKTKTKEKNGNKEKKGENKKD